MGFRPLRLVAIAVALGAMTTPALPGLVAGAVTAPAIQDRIGVAAGSAILWEDDASRQAELDAIAATGARWFSIDVDWPSIQPTGRYEFDWSVTDTVVREAKARDLLLIGMIGYSPDWAQPASCPSGTTHCLPRYPEDYARFAKAAALRYGTHAFDASLRGSISTWQIWNEANHVPFVQPTVDVAGYTRMLQAAYAEIKKVDPTSTVLAAGTAPAPDDPSGRDMAPVTFLEGIYANGGGDSFDAMAHHPYSFPCNPLINRSWNAFFQTYWIHQAMVRHGDGERKVWGTEAGAPTGSDVGTCGGRDGVSVSEAEQATVARDYLRGWTQTFGSFTGPFLWYQIRDNGTDPQNYDDNLGLLRRDFSAKPAYLAVTQFLANPGPSLPASDPSAPADPPPASPPPAPTNPPVIDPPNSDVSPPPASSPPSSVSASECDVTSPTVRPSGVQADRLTPSFDRSSTVDARTASWTQVDPWPVSITGAGPVCWSGGTVVGTYPVDTPWDVFHSTGAFNVANPDAVIEGLRIHNYGDGVRLRSGADRWRIRGAHLSSIHDDCVENDKLGSGVVSDSFLDGCYVGFSTRPTAADTTSDGHANTFVVDGSLVRLRPMPAVYKGPAPGHGGFFKWDTDEGRSPELVVRNNVFRVDQAPNHGSLGLPDGYAVTCSHNVIVWLGEGEFPGRASWLGACPDTRIVTSASVWDDAVRAWTAQHP